MKLRMVTTVALVLLSIQSVAGAQPIVANPPALLPDPPLAHQPQPGAVPITSLSQPRPPMAAPGPIELSLQLTGNVAYREVSDQSGVTTRLFVPYADAGVWLGTGLGADRRVGYAIGYRGRLARAPAETAHRHALSLALVREDMTGFIDAGLGFFTGEGDGTEHGTSVFCGATLQANIAGTAFTLVVPVHAEFVVAPVASVWVTMGLGIGFSTL